MSVKELIMELSNLTFEHSESIPSKLFKDLLDKTKEVYDKVEQEEKKVNTTTIPTNRPNRNVIIDDTKLEEVMNEIERFTDLKNMYEKCFDNMYKKQYQEGKRFENIDENVRNDIIRDINLRYSAKRGYYHKEKMKYSYALIQTKDEALGTPREDMEEKIIDANEKIRILLRETGSLDSRCRAKCKNGNWCKNTGRNSVFENYGYYNFKLCNRHNNNIQERIRVSNERERYWENVRF